MFIHNINNALFKLSSISCINITNTILRKQNNKPKFQKIQEFNLNQYKLINNYYFRKPKASTYYLQILINYNQVQ